jgi:DNA-binding NarL/FixJ family response regulator
MSIAYSVTGSGPPLVLMPYPMSHLHLRWQNDPEFIQPLAERFTLVQYDGRGQGMSSRGLPESHTFEDYVTDIKAVADALHLTRFAIWADVFQTHIAVQFAAQYPQRVSALILRNCQMKGESTIVARLEDLASRDWDSFLGVISQALLPFTKGSTGILAQSATQADYLARIRAIKKSDLAPVLPRIACPVLILAVFEGVVAFEEEARRVAGLLPQSRLLILKLEDLSGRHAQIAEEFVLTLDPRAAAATSESIISARELDVLRLLAAGRSNQQVAHELFISLNTVRRHVSNIFTKIGAANRADAVSYAHRHGLISER